MNNLIIGETCLLSKQLKRIGITDGPTKMFDDVLVNLDSIMLIIDNDFNDILKGDYLTFTDYMFYPEYNIHYSKWINNLYSVPDNNMYSWPIYAPLFHHDSATEQERESYIRKIERTKKIFEDPLNTIVYYYHRHHSNSNISNITQKFIQFIEFLNLKYKKRFKGVIFTNNISNIKKIETNILTQDLVHAHFLTTDSWIGIDDNWDAHTDNELFDQFFSSDIYKSIL